ncbi:ferredoxin [Streptomyces sp. KL116D]|uniref:ferredoxin n=1 Tax=Streptomyces sp. KL116D TaxID=3045152 RepID=UPI003557F871
MKVVVDMNKCQDHGQCASAAPHVFSCDDAGRLAYVPDPDDALRRRGRGSRRHARPLQATRIELSAVSAPLVVARRLHGRTARRRTAARRRLGGPITVVGDEPHYALTTWPLAVRSSPKASLDPLAFRGPA